MAAVAISGLTLWDSHQDRVRGERKDAATASRAASEAAILILRATPSRSGDRLALAPLNGEQAIQAQTILFPTALGLSPVETTGDPRVEAGWFDEALKRARKAAGEAEDGKGDQRLPIVLVTHYLADGGSHTARAIHDVGYTIDGRFLRGSAVTLRGMSIVATVGASGAQTALDAVWRKRHPAAAVK